METGDCNDVVEIILRRGQEGLGFNIRGGIDMPHIPEDVGIFVTKIREVGAAAIDGRLSEGDKIVKLNDRSLLKVTHQTAVSLFKSAGDEVKLSVIKDAERKAIEAAHERRMQAAKKNHIPGDQTQKVLTAVSAVSLALVIGYFAYRNRSSLSSFVSKLFTRPDRYSSITARSYGRF